MGPSGLGRNVPSTPEASGGIIPPPLFDIVKSTREAEDRFRSRRHVGQPDHVLVHLIAGDEAERWARAGEEWLAATKHDGVEVESILINKTKVGQASCQAWSGHGNLACELCLQATYDCLDVIRNKCGFGADRH